MQPIARHPALSPTAATGARRSTPGWQSTRHLRAVIPKKTAEVRA